MGEIVHSNVTGKDYNSSDIVRLLNPQQCAAYLKHNAQLLDVYPSISQKDDRPVLVYIFSRIGTSELYNLWCEHKLN